MLRTLLFSSILFSFYLPVSAWDETGHKITAYIAWQRMTPAVRERVVKILTEAPEDSHLGTFYISYSSRDAETVKREYFMLASTWADMIKDRNFFNRNRKYNKGNWHYDDKFWTLREGKIEYLPAPKDGGLALSKVIEFDEVIRGNASDAQKAIAIAWLEHVIGDLHQPLHTSARVTEKEPKGDEGGNLFLLTPEGTERAQRRNLHSYWDGIIVRMNPNSKNECDIGYAEPLAEKIMKMHPYSKVQARLAPGKYDEWVAESLTIAQTEVYSADLKRFEMPSEKYRKKALKISQEQLALAGYRIGDLFNQAFGVAPAVKP